MQDYLESYTQRIRVIYNALQDDLSKSLFECRILFHMTGDAAHLMKMYNNGRWGGVKFTILDLFARLSIVNKKVIMYGSGRYAKRLYNLLISANLDVYHFCDSDKSKAGTLYMGIPVISPEELVRLHMDKYVLISSAYYVEEIYAYLSEIGFPMENVFVPGNFSEQYFGEEFLRPVENEIYVDAGCYTGDTINGFMKFSSNNYKRIYGLEPSNANYRVLSDAFSSEKRIILEKKGAWSCETAMFFNENGSCSLVVDDGADRIEMTTIDKLVGDDAVTLIKMDVEGAELEALKGASNTIVKNKPRMAISIYHKSEDVLTVPLYIHELVPEYVFYLRHHAPYPDFSETVLYAVIK